MLNHISKNKFGYIDASIISSIVGEKITQTPNPIIFFIISRLFANMINPDLFHCVLTNRSCSRQVLQIF